MSDPAVGIHTGTGRTVYQCQKTKMLYFLQDPTKRYVSQRQTEFSATPPKPCPKKKKKK
jgi:hypothetical protein